MLPKIVFATNNPNKLKEVREQLEGTYDILSLKDINCREELPETTGTIEGNARQKAEYVLKHYETPCFADDTGLEVDALNGEPGVDSAYYAGSHRSADDNMNLVLEKLQNASSRKAHFKTVIALAQTTGTELFEGIAEGSITHEKSGSEGFGYDPIFLPLGHKLTFSEMTMEEKNRDKPSR